MGDAERVARDAERARHQQAAQQRRQNEAAGARRKADYAESVVTLRARAVRILAESGWSGGVLMPTGVFGRRRAMWQLGRVGGDGERSFSSAYFIGSDGNIYVERDGKARPAKYLTNDTDSVVARDLQRLIDRLG